MDWSEIYERLKSDPENPDPEAYEALKTRVAVWAFRDLQGKPWRTIEEVIEETREDVVVNLHKARGAATFSRFVWDQYRNARRKVFRRPAVVPFQDIDLTVDDAPELSDERLEALIDCWEGLGAHDKEILRLRFYEDLPHQQIAVRLGIKEATARVRLKRALAPLSDCVRKKFRR